MIRLYRLMNEQGGETSLVSREQREKTIGIWSKPQRITGRYCQPIDLIDRAGDPSYQDIC